MSFRLLPLSPYWIFGAVAVFLLALTFRPVVEGDGIGYYTYLHAALVSHSLDFTNEYAAAVAAQVPLSPSQVATRTSSGHLVDVFSVGSAVLAAPAYLVALLLRPNGEPQYGSPFVEAFSLASLFYALLALAICYRLAVAIVPNRRAALIGVLGALFATPLAYYMLYEPSYSHTFSVFCVSAFLYAWWTGPPRTVQGWFALGLLGGVMGMTRFQDGLLVAIVLIDARRLNWRTLMMVPGLLLGFAPQFAVDQLQFGTWLPERIGQALDPVHGHYLEVLFGSKSGLFVWTPAALVAGAGIFMIHERRIKLACGLAFLIEIAISGATPDSAGVAFGARRLLDLIPFAVLGITVVASRLGSRTAWGLVGVLSAWNLTLIANFVYVVGARDPGLLGLLQGQLAALPYLPRLLAKGAVVRDLLLWSQANTRFEPVRGLIMLALEAACVAASLLVAGRLRGSPTATGAVSAAAGHLDPEHGSF